MSKWNCWSTFYRYWAESVSSEGLFASVGRFKKICQSVCYKTFRRRIASKDLMVQKMQEVYAFYKAHFLGEKVFAKFIMNGSCCCTPWICRRWDRHLESQNWAVASKLHIHEHKHWLSRSNTAYCKHQLERDFVLTGLFSTKTQTLPWKHTRWPSTSVHVNLWSSSYTEVGTLLLKTVVISTDAQVHGCEYNTDESTYAHTVVFVNLQDVC